LFIYWELVLHKNRELIHQILYRIPSYIGNWFIILVFRETVSYNKGNGSSYIKNRFITCQGNHEHFPYNNQGLASEFLGFLQSAIKGA
jgi:hypothetical protein